MSLSPAQIELRRTRIGSSEIGALVDFYAKEGAPRCDPYKTAQQVFNEKDLPPEPSAAEKSHQRWGHFQEPGILQFHAEEHGLKLVHAFEMDLDEPDTDHWRTLLHPSLPLCATPDGIGLRGIERLRDIQAKNAQRWGSHRWGEPGTDDAPLLYVAQVTVELGILLQHEKFMGRIDDVGDLAVCLEGAPPTAYHIRFDPELFGSLAELAKKFARDHLVPRKPPQLDGSDPAAEYVRRRWEKHIGALKPWSEEAQAEADTALEAARLIEEYSEVREAARNKLKNLIGSAAGIEGLCTWKRAKDSAEVITDWKAVAEEAAFEACGHDHERAMAFLAPILDTHTAARVTKKGSRRLLFTKANGQAEVEPETKEKEEAAA